jgi:CheY-like chemotaxis protein
VPLLQIFMKGHRAPCASVFFPCFRAPYIALATSGRTAMSPHRLILSVELDPVLLSTRTLLLQSAGYSVCAVTSCRQALAERGSQFFDVLIISHTVSESDQQILLEAAKKARPSMPVLVLETSIGPPSAQLEPGTRSVDSHQPDKVLDTVGEMMVPKHAPQSVKNITAFLGRGKST